MSENLRHNALLFQLSNAFIVEFKELSKDLIGVLAERWRGRPDTRFGMGILDGGVNELDWAAIRMLDLLDHPSCLDCCIVSRLEAHPALSGNSPCE